MVCSDHEDHLNELGALLGELPAEPQEREDAANAHLLLKDFGDGHAAVLQLLAAIIRDGGDEVRWFADHAQLLSPCVVHGHLRCLPLWGLNDLAAQHEVRVDLVDHLGQLVERVRDVEACLLHRLVLGRGGLHVSPCLRSRVAELHLSGEARGASANAPRDHGLGDAARLHGLNKIILVHPANLAQQQQDLGARVVLVPQEVVQKAAARVAVATDGHALVDAVRVPADDVVQLVGHATGLGDVSDGARAVEAGHHDVVEHAACVPDPQAAGLDAAHGRWTNHADLLGLRRLDEVTGLLFGHALRNDCDGLDLRVLHRLHGCLVNRAEGRKVDEDRGVGVLLTSFLGRGVHRHEGFLCTPIELDVMVA
mmetsp:Transcript_23113/g.64129  ORF Transcript_23113/g.64129 Transcript_23113/m.64129 type:complete len:367 (+) Transcript_23113:930-2030(+)